MPHFESLKLYELRSLALRDLNIPVAAIRQYGDLRLRATWLSAIAAHSDTTGLALKDNWRDGERQVTCGHFVHKFTVIQNEFGFVAGQLIPHGIPAAIAVDVGELVTAGRWAKAFEQLQNYPRGYRILTRVREVVAA